ncbi:MAG: hypothetical protein M3Y87_15515, partial [Myxococcota bacterium]|nr:hypothetical protein [Myxococcota bacterium]
MRRVNLVAVEPGTVGPSSPRAPTASRKSPAIWIALAVVVVIGGVIAAASSRGRSDGLAHDGDRAPAIVADVAVPPGAPALHPP